MVIEHAHPSRNNNTANTGTPTGGELFYCHEVVINAKDANLCDV